jgi:hypothetical protein
VFCQALATVNAYPPAPARDDAGDYTSPRAQRAGEAETARVDRMNTAAKFVTDAVLRVDVADGSGNQLARCKEITR